MIGENKMLKRIASTGVNLVVLGVSVGIFLVAFFALNALGAAQKPPTISVLSATRDLNIGDVISPNDLAVKTVFQDDNASLYIPGEEVTSVVDGVVAQPILWSTHLSSPQLLRRLLKTRLSAVLAQYPE
jgi:Flp pilus assembly protein CpaB